MFRRLLELLKGENAKEASSLGRRGEDAAARFLESKGYKVVERNFSVRRGEIDIICTRGDMLVFVEVKARGKNRLGEPFEAVGAGKQLRVLAAAKEYLRKVTHGGGIRFDVISVVDTGAGLELEHIEDAFGE